MQIRKLVMSAILLSSTVSVNIWAAAKESVLYAFKGGTDGAYPSSSLIRDALGDLYGTASSGGNLSNCTGFGVPGCGVVFELKPTNGVWQENVLYAFQGGTDGSKPSGNLVFDSSGNLYGTTVSGGTGTACQSSGCGTVFKLSPNQDGSWTETVLYSFQSGNDGAFPVGLTADTAGNLYGITTSGGNDGVGIAYELSPSREPASSWTRKILYSFTQFESAPNPRLVFDNKGNLYGTYHQLYGCYVACGAVFELKSAQGTWTETDLFKFPGGGNGGNPMAGVVFDNAGNLYGTGALGGNNFGMAFELTPSGSTWKGSMLHNFCSVNGCADGASPQTALVMDSDGVLYGTTSRNSGNIFKLVRGRLAWGETVLYSFSGGSDGASPAGSLIIDTQHNLYGSTSFGGNKYGVVFELTQ